MSDKEENHLEIEVEPSQTISDGFANQKQEKKEEITIEQASEELHSIAPSPGSVQSLAEARKTYRTRVSGQLAKFLWYLLGGVVTCHMVSTIAFSWQLTQKPSADDKEQYSERIKGAISSVNEAAKTLYTFLGPLATAVTGYYFTTVGNSSNDSEND
ncbi:MAG: hypothetical protein C6Y22_18300 [Hapalosiphonaceae cyanobacterium JJU2]|nr:MAG: hypothetical protein C6Y22_18300 [Hapalosiphonaceae cyanobacterium JJU2]